MIRKKRTVKDRLYAWLFREQIEKQRRREQTVTLNVALDGYEDVMRKLANIRAAIVEIVDMSSNLQEALEDIDRRRECKCK